MTTKNPKEFWSKREKFEQPDECYTPENAIIPLLQFIPKEKVIWDCAYGSGMLANHFNKQGFKVVGEDKLNFFDEDLYCHYIITNPPYSKKDEFLRRAFELGKPFAFLLPLTTLEGIKRGKMFSDNEIQIIIPNRRFNFANPIKRKSKGSCWFATAWFCWKLNLPKQLNFIELNREDA
jgi:hypothetical protein